MGPMEEKEKYLEQWDQEHQVKVQTVQKARQVAQGRQVQAQLVGAASRDVQARAQAQATVGLVHQV
jgi:hypothetical protein